MFGSYFSLMNYDTLSTNPWNCMNLHMNQAYDHMQTWPGFFNVQRYSFDNFTPYGSAYSNSFLLDPRYTIMQKSWGTPAWQNLPFTDWSKNPNGSWNWSPWGQNWSFNNSTNNASSSTDPDQIEHREKYNKLLSLAKQVKDYGDLSNTEKRTLQAAINDTKGTDKEKFEKLLKAYKTISKETIKSFLVENGQNLAVKDPSASGNDSSKNNFYYQLTQTGYEYKETTMDIDVENFYNSIKNELKGNDGSAEIAAGEIAKLNIDNVLDFISSFNSKYSKTNEPKRIIDHIKEEWSSVGGAMQSTVSSTIIVPLVDTLKSKAQDVRKHLDEDSQEAIKLAIEELEEAKYNSKTSIDSNLSAAFDKLYLLTRQGAVAKVRNDAIAYYGEIDSDIFNSKLFADEVKKDLIEEGFEDKDIENTEVSISEKEAKKSSKSSKNDVEETPEEKKAREEEERKKAEEAEAKRAEQEKRSSIEKKEENITAGMMINQNLTGWSWSDQPSININNTLEKINENNVMDVLTGYYINAGKLGATEGLIERLDDEHDGDKIEITNKIKVIDSLLKVAAKNDLKTSKHYIAIENIMTKYKTGGEYYDKAQGKCTKDTFNHGGFDRSFTSEGAWSAIGAVVMNCFGLGWTIGLKTDNEVIDEHLEALFQEIKAKQAK